MNGIYGISKISFPALMDTTQAPAGTPLFMHTKRDLYYNKEHFYGFLTHVGAWGTTRKLIPKKDGQFDYIVDGKYAATFVVIAQGRGARV
ncbi:hypothetical protein MAC3UK_0003 [Bdellovibrio phage MAC3UK]|nr:hypothetical protein MAC3UK_0003 [Bdellovibrio phage MAC3UK]